MIMYFIVRSFDAGIRLRLMLNDIYSFTNFLYKLKKNPFHFSKMENISFLFPEKNFRDENRIEVHKIFFPMLQLVISKYFF